MPDRPELEEAVLSMLKAGGSYSCFLLAERIQADVESIDEAVTSLHAAGLIKYELEVVPLEGHTKYKQVPFWSI